MKIRIINKNYLKYFFQAEKDRLEKIQEDNLRLWRQLQLAGRTKRIDQQWNHPQPTYNFFLFAFKLILFHNLKRNKLYVYFYIIDF